MQTQDSFRTFKTWYRGLKVFLRLVEAKGNQLEQVLVSRFPTAFRKAVLSFTDTLQNQPLISFVIFFALVCSRAFYWLQNPQFYIEDGPEFYAPAFNLGINTLTRDYASYYHAVPRILSLIAASFPVRYGPLAMELLALAIQAAVAAFIVSARLRDQFESSGIRFVLAFMVIGYPYSNELFGNIAHSQWYLGILSIGLVYADPGKRTVTRIADSIVLTLNCLTGPFAPLIAAAAWLKWRADRSRLTMAIIATVTAGITILAILAHPRSGIHNHSRFSLLERMISNQVVLGSVRGFRYMQSVPYEPFFNLREFLTAAVGITVVLLGLRKSPPVIRALAALGLFSWLTSLDSRASWVLLGAVGVGERYFFYLGLVFLFCCYILSLNASSAVLRWLFRSVLLCSTVSVLQNWVYDPPFAAYNYPPQIAKYGRLAPGQTLEIKIPIDRKIENNHWTMTLKRK